MWFDYRIVNSEIYETELFCLFIELASDTYKSLVSASDFTCMEVENYSKGKYSWYKKNILHAHRCQVSSKFVKTWRATLAIIILKFTII